ncbi:MAG: hypothetical protein HGA77_04930 [Chlorobiaceae bacterium]|nr:hypothetical protein [Chlorobiaceae bacterium]
MKAVTYIEIDVPICSRSFGNAPCGAQYAAENIVYLRSFDDEGSDFGATIDDDGLLSAYVGCDDEGFLNGGGECYKTIATCQDTENYSGTTATLRFAYADADDKGAVDAIPSISSVSFRPQQVSLGENLGVRASLTVTFVDHRWPETHNAGDPYWSTRGYDPYPMGTFWGKFRARYKYMQGAVIRYIVGIEGQALSQMETRSFVIEKISGPSLDGKVTITAKDILKLADDEKAQCPVISTGRCLGDVTSSATSFSLTPTGIGDSEYPTSGYVAIGGKEICSFTRSGDAMTITRAQFGTSAIEHKQNDIVQLCYAVFDSGGNGLDPSDILYDLLVNYTAVDTSWITLSDWQAKTDLYIGRLYYGLVAEPTAVRTLINELIEQCGLIIWSDDINRKIRLDVVRKLNTPSVQIDEDSWAKGSFTVSDQPDKRVSQTWVYYGMRNPLEASDDVTNFTAAVAVIDDEAEVWNGQPSIKKIFSRFIPRNNRPAASDLAYKILARFREAPRAFEFSLWRHGNISLGLAQAYNLKAWPLQLPSGEQATVPGQIIEINPGDDFLKAKAQELSWYEYGDLPDQGLIVVIDADAVDVNFRTEYDKSYNPPDSGKTVTCLIESGVKVGTSGVGYAFTVGSWPAGVNLLLINNGVISGKGGNGGGSLTDFSVFYDAQDGGSSIYTRTAITVQNNGVICSGGGGGGYAYFYENQHKTCTPGSGGAGYPVGSKGTGYCNYDKLVLYGNNGTATTGGASTAHTHNVTVGTGGAGGDLSENGDAGVRYTGSGSGVNGSGGSAGIAVDGISYCTVTGSGSIIGTQTN